MAHELRQIEDLLKYAEESDPFRTNNPASSYRRITAEEALAQRSGNAKVNLWVNQNAVHKNDVRRCSGSSTTGRRGSNDSAMSSSRRGSNSGAISRRYHARMDAGVLSDDDDEEEDHNSNSTHSCSSSEDSTKG